MNSRPLTFVGEEIGGVSPLTPACFLVGNGNVYDKENTPAEVPTTKEALEGRKLVHDTLMEKFWVLWSKDYIRNLPAWRGSGKCSNLREGSMALVREEGYPRLRWPLGRVVETYPGKDGVLRSCKIKTVRGDFIRPIQRLHELELSTGAPPEEIDQEVTQDATKTDVVGNSQPSVKTSRFGRVIKPVTKLNL